MKTIIPICIIGIVLLSSLLVMADAQPKYASEIEEVTGGIGHISVTIKNTGYASLDDFEYSISINGGFGGKIDLSETCALDVLETHASEISDTNEPIFGFGTIDITIDADFADTWEGTGFIVGPFVFAIKEK